MSHLLFAINVEAFDILFLKICIAFLEEEKILPEEQKGCKRNSRGTKDQVFLDKAVLRDRKRRSTNLAMAWIDYRKAYGMIPYSWINECPELFKVAKNTRKLDSCKQQE